MIYKLLFLVVVYVGAYTDEYLVITRPKQSFIIEKYLYNQGRTC